MPPRRQATPAAAAAAAQIAQRQHEAPSASSLSSSSSSSSFSAVASGLAARVNADGTNPPEGLSLQQLGVMVGVPVPTGSHTAPTVGIGPPGENVSAHGFGGGGEYSKALHQVGRDKVAGGEPNGMTGYNDEGEGGDDEEEIDNADSPRKKKRNKKREQTLGAHLESTLSTKLIILSKISFSPALLQQGAPSVAAKLVGKLWSNLNCTNPFADEAKLLVESANLFRDCLDGRQMEFKTFWEAEGDYFGGKRYVYRMFRDRRISVMQIIVRYCDPNACHMC